VTATNQQTALSYALPPLVTKLCKFAIALLMLNAVLNGSIAACSVGVMAFYLRGFDLETFLYLICLPIVLGVLWLLVAGAIRRAPHRAAITGLTLCVLQTIVIVWRFVVWLLRVMKPQTFLDRMLWGPASIDWAYVVLDALFLALQVLIVVVLIRILRGKSASFPNPPS